MRTNDWTEERLEILRTMLAQKYSFGVIGARLGVSRNAAIGMARRKGYECMRPQGTNGGTPGELPRPKVSPPMPQVTNDMLVPLCTEKGGHITMLDLTHKTCRWPIGDPTEASFHFCGHPPVPGRPYCPYHHRIAFQKTRA
jgi:GcrA cell cycle regulator